MKATELDVLFDDEHVVKPKVETTEKSISVIGRITGFMFLFIVMLLQSCSAPDHMRVEQIHEQSQDMVVLPPEMIGGYYSNAYNEEKGSITIDSYILYIQLENHVYQVLLENAKYEQCNLIVTLADGTEIRIVNFTPYGYIRLTINGNIIGNYYKSKTYGG